MSKLRNVDVKCPQCGRPGTFEVWDSVNVDLDPDMRDKILTEEIFVWTCPHCNAQVYNPYGFLYHDMKHKFMLFFDPEEPEDGKKYETMQIDAVFHFTEDYTFRIVYGIKNLKEKMFIFEAGLDDVAMMRVKYFLRNYIHPAELKDNESFMFIKCLPPSQDNNMEEELLFAYYDKNINDMNAFSIRKDTYLQALDAIQLDPRFKDVGAQCVDEEWIGLKLKGVE